MHGNVVVPDGDVLVFAGDMMTCGYRLGELSSFADWFRALPHKHKVVIAGNHDRALENSTLSGLFEDCHYLLDSGCEIYGYDFWGSPYTPEFCNWAFNVPRGQLYKHWNLIPESTDILITHGPPYGTLDGPYRVRDKHAGWKDEYLGCPELAERLKVMEPAAHIFGHIHNGFGHKRGTAYYNVSVLNDQYRLTNPCTIIDV